MSSIPITEATLKGLNKSKKVPFDPKNWAFNKNKAKKDRGEEYSIVKGNRAGTVVPAIVAPSGVKCCRCVKPGCNLNANIYSEYYRTFRSVNVNQQNQILSECIEIRNPTKRGVEKENAQHFKANTFVYSLKVLGKRERLCRKKLLDTFKVTENRLRTITGKMGMGKITFEDCRGKACGVHPGLLTDDFKNDIRAHIRSFPTYVSHYCRNENRSEKLYLDEDLCVKKMLELFNSSQTLKGGRICKYDSYHHIFKTEFNLGFGLPRKDTCNFCDEQKGQINRENSQSRREILEECLATHKELAKAARIMHEEDGARQGGKYFSITADMEKVLFLPRLSCSSHFFKRKLSTFNLGIHVTGKDKATMNIWDETIAEHSSKDVLSCLYKYITSTFEKLQGLEERHFTLWSDRYVGQFNNGFTIVFMKYMSDLGYFTTFEHKMFLTGHSWMNCDRDFGLIEKKFVQCNPIVPADLEKVILSARPSNPFEIVKMKREDFYDFSKLIQYVSIPKELQVTKFHLYRYETTDPGQIFAKQYHNSVEWSRFSFCVKQCGGLSKLKSLPPAYLKPVQISAEKAKDLRDLMTKILDKDKFLFYENLTKPILD